MGTDIHAFVEFDASGEPPFEDTYSIRSVAAGAFALDRDYGLFDALAWARSSQGDPEDRQPPPVVEPRGIPPAVSMSVARRYYAIETDSDRPDPYFWPAHAVISGREAQEWVRKGSVRSSIEQTFNTTKPRPQVWPLVSKPWWHSATWLTPSEFEAALAQSIAENGEPPAFTWRLLREVLATCAREFGPERTRLVIWFDS